MPGSLFVGVDVGGGGVRVCAGAGPAAARVRDPGPVPRRANAIDVEALSLRIVQLIAQVAGSDRRIARVAIGVTGMPGLLADPGDLAAHIHRHVDAEAVIIASDALTTHLGALHGQPGTVVAAGTGVIALGTDHDNIWQQVDGWGYLLGDEGGGAWIGVRGLNAALRTQDRRSAGSAFLLEGALAEFRDLDAALAAIYNSPSPAYEAAKFAPVVAEAAHRGDVIAIAIWEQAGRHMAESAHAASAGLPRQFSWGGRLFDAGDILLAPFRDELLRRVPDAILVPPSGQAADGAWLLASVGLSGIHGARPDNVGSRRDRVAEEFPRRE